MDRKSTSGKTIYRNETAGGYTFRIPHVYEEGHEGEEEYLSARYPDFTEQELYDEDGFRLASALNTGCDHFRSISAPEEHQCMHCVYYPADLPWIGVCACGERRRMREEILPCVARPRQMTEEETKTEDADRKRKETGAEPAVTYRQTAEDKRETTDRQKTKGHGTEAVMDIKARLQTNRKKIIGIGSVLAGLAAAIIVVLFFAQTTVKGPHTVTFVDAQGQELLSHTVEHGETLAVADVPILPASGAVFGGWYADEDFTTPYYPDEPVEADITVRPLLTQQEDIVTHAPERVLLGDVGPDIAIVLLSEKELTEQNLKDVAELTMLHGDAPDIQVESLGEKRYRVTADYQPHDHPVWTLTDESVSFEGQEAASRTAECRIVGEEYENAVYTKQVKETKPEDLAAFHEDAYGEEGGARALLFGEKFEKGDVVCLQTGEAETDIGWYKVETAKAKNEARADGAKLHELTLRDASWEDVFEELELRLGGNAEQHLVFEEVDTEALEEKLMADASLAVYGDYLAMTINDSPTWQQLIASGDASYLTPQSPELREKANCLAGTDATFQRLSFGTPWDFQLMDVNISLTDENNAFWDNRYKQPGVMQWDDINQKYIPASEGPGLGLFKKAEIAATFGYSSDGTSVSATAVFTASVKVCPSGTLYFLLDYNQIHPNTEIDLSVTAYVEAGAKVDIVATVGGRKYNIGEELKNASKRMSGAQGTSDGYWVELYRSVYDGKSNTGWVTVFEEELIRLSFAYKFIQIDFPISVFVDTVVRGELGFDFTYRTAQSMTAYKKKGEKINTIQTSYSSGLSEYDYTFYTGGYLGIREGVKLEVEVGPTGFAKYLNLGFGIKVGNYNELFGLFYLNSQSNQKVTDSGAVSYGATTERAGAYYFETGIFLDLYFKCEAVVWEGAWAVYNGQWPLAHVGDKHAFVDFKDVTDNPEEMETFYLVAPKDYDKETMTGTYIGTNGKSYGIQGEGMVLYAHQFAGEASFIDLESTKELGEDSNVAQELLAKYVTATSSDAGFIASPDGRICLRSNAIDGFYGKNAAKPVRETILTLYYNGPSFAFGYTPYKKVRLIAGSEEGIKELTEGEPCKVTYTAGGVVFCEMEVPYGTRLAPPKWMPGINSSSTVFNIDYPKEKGTSPYDLAYSFFLAKHGMTYMGWDDVYSKVTYVTKDMTVEAGRISYNMWNYNVHYMIPMWGWEGRVHGKEHDYYAYTQGGARLMSVPEVKPGELWPDMAHSFARADEDFIGWKLWRVVKLDGTENKVPPSYAGEKHPLPETQEGQMNVPVTRTDYAYYYEAVYRERVPKKCTVTFTTVKDGKETVLTQDAMEDEEVVFPVETFEGYWRGVTIFGGDQDSAYRRRADGGWDMVIYPFSDVSVRLEYHPVEYLVSFISAIDNSVIETQKVAHGKKITPPDTSEKNRHLVDDGNGNYYGGGKPRYLIEQEDGTTLRFRNFSSVIHEPVYSDTKVYVYFEEAKYSFTVHVRDEQKEYTGIRHGTDLNALLKDLTVIDDPLLTYNFIHWKRRSDGDTSGKLTQDKAVYDAVFETRGKHYTFAWADTEQTKQAYLPGLTTLAPIPGEARADNIDGFLANYFNTLPVKPVIKTSSGQERTYKSYVYTLQGTVCYVSLDFGGLKDICSVTYDVGDGRLFQRGVPQAKSKESMTYDVEIEEGKPYKLAYSAYPSQDWMMFVGWEYYDEIYEADASFDLSGKTNVTLRAVYEPIPVEEPEPETPAPEPAPTPAVQYVTWTFDAGEGCFEDGSKTRTFRFEKGTVMNADEFLKANGLQSPNVYKDEDIGGGNMVRYDFVGWSSPVPNTADQDMTFVAGYE